MAALPEEFQVEFWKKNFQPLLEEEDILRQKLAEVLKSSPDHAHARTLTPNYTEPARKGGCRQVANFSGGEV
jgi:hypothetical protein